MALTFAGSLPAAELTALAAVKLIPQERAARLARIEARDGTPEADRWYLLVQDPNDENGVHEFVVANGEIVSSRPISQFAEKLQPQDVIGVAAIKIDSDQLAKLARQYAQASNATISRISYELKKEGADAAPVWKVVCFDDTDKRVGELVVTAGKGNVISHDGFAPLPRAGTPKKPAKFAVYAEPEVAKADPSAPPPAEEYPETEQRRRREVDDRGHPVGDTMKNVGRSIRKFLPF
ncbi:MAG: hypothetical protein QOD99_962 [Chthoniobacter sp.]|nr:hypothetical protein [Chthoniobacter sp.]